MDIFNAFIIFFREGLEALLILSSVMITLRVMKLKDKLGILLYKGAFSAILASVLLYIASISFMNITHVSQEILEGWTMLFASGVLFYLSYWLISKIQADRWQKFIANKTKEAITKGKKFALYALSFTVVFREGFETVLMLTALKASGASAIEVCTGTGLAAAALVFTGIAIFYAGLNVPIKLFFTVTSAFLLLLVFRFSGKGIHELQGARIIPESAVNISFIPDVLRTLFNIYPTLETSMLQGIYLAAIIIGVVLSFRKSNV